MRNLTPHEKWSFVASDIKRSRDCTAWLVPCPMLICNEFAIRAWGCKWQMGWFWGGKFNWENVPVWRNFPSFLMSGKTRTTRMMASLFKARFGGEVIILLSLVSAHLWRMLARRVKSLFAVENPSSISLPLPRARSWKFNFQCFWGKRNGNGRGEHLSKVINYGILRGGRAE